jgi:hypothetical protein
LVITGVPFAIANANAALEDPIAFVAVTVSFVEVSATPGVPEIKPVEVLNERPVGSAGAIEKLVATPPLLVIV